MKKISILALICAMSIGVWAIPARRGGITMVQPDGSEITVFQHGDEHFHWQTNEKGEWLKLDDDGFYRITEALSVEQVEAKRAQSASRAAQAAVPLNVAPRGLVLLVNFTDVAFETEKAEMDSMLNGKNYTRTYSYTYRGKTYFVDSEGSASQYFYESSYGQYNPQFDVVGPITVNKNMAYYGKNGYGDFDQAPWTMVKEACEIADTLYNIDFAEYDNDDDGYVDFVYVIYAGFGEADGGGANTIWPHSYNLEDAGLRCIIDNKRVDLYACGNELDFYSKIHTGIGAFCHEFSHVLGLPDLYVTNTATHNTLGMWSVMDYGPYNNESNTPPSYTAYERFFMGWLQPRLITEPEDVVLENLQDSQEALLISTTDVHNLVGNDPSPTTFYLLENRQQKGWDLYLPGHGLMLTKVQYSYSKWFQNTVNNSSSKMGVDIIEADGKSSREGDAGDLFPAGATQYLAIDAHPIEGIEENDGIITFQYKKDPGTAVEDAEVGEYIIAIYNILGQQQSSTKLNELPRGTYIIKTMTGSRKIVR